MDKKARLLYVEDDAALSFITKDNLEMHGYDVGYCENGEQALHKIQQKSYDLIILDVMLPKIDGFTIAKKIRETNKHIPILFLTAKSSKEDKIQGLRLGADDYITKPFSIEELILKIEIFLKRANVVDGNYGNSQNINTHTCQIGKFLFDFNNLLLIDNGNEKKLTYKEAALIQYLFNNLGKVVKREDILVDLWGENDYFMGRSLDVFISRLRKYFKKDPDIKIDTIHGLGFKFSLIG